MSHEVEPARAAELLDGWLVRVLDAEAAAWLAGRRSALADARRAPEPRARWSLRPESSQPLT